MKECIIDTASGVLIDLFNPDLDLFDIDDIAHALSNQCRFNGQCREFYSVAEHSVLVSRLAPSFKLECLMHDAAEAYIGDVVYPVKVHLDDFKKIEKIVDDAICNKFLGGQMSETLKTFVKYYDHSVLRKEAKYLMPKPNQDKYIIGGVPIGDVWIEALPPKQAYMMFMQEYDKLKGGK